MERKPPMIPMHPIPMPPMFHYPHHYPKHHHRKIHHHSLYKAYRHSKKATKILKHLLCHHPWDHWESSSSSSHLHDSSSSSSSHWHGSSSS